MKNKIKILLLEDNEFDVELIRHDLDQSDLDFDMVHTSEKDAFANLVKESEPDIIISDFYMKGFTGYDILLVRNDLFPELPFIIVTGSVSEDVAVKCMKAGADDYILKNQQKRLPYAIREALEKRKIKKEKDFVLRELFLNERKFRILAERSTDIIFRYNFYPSEGIEFLSSSFYQIFGYETDEVRSNTDILKKIIHPTDFEKMKDSLIGTSAEPVLIRWIKKDGAVFWGEHICTPVYDETGRVIISEGIIRDVTGRTEEGERLKESEEKYRLLFENNPKAMWVFDAETMQFLAVNDAAVQSYGYTRDEFLSMTLADIRPKDDIPKLLNNIAHAGGILQHSGYWRHLKKDGSVIYVEIDSHKIDYLNKNARLVIVTDVTGKRETELRLNMVQRATEQAPVCIMLTDSNGKIVYVNPAFLSLTGYSSSEVIGKMPSILNSGEHDREFFKNLWDTIKGGETWHGEIRNRKKDGTLVWENVIISPVKDKEDEITNFVAVKEDITQKKELFEAVITAKNKAEEMSRLKSSFLANMSHELRTPMIGILGYSEVIMEVTGDQAIHQYAEKMNNSGMRLMETLNQILDLSKIEAEKTEIILKTVEIVKLAREVVEDFRALALRQQNQISLDTGEPEMFITTDERLLRSVLHNLVSNAVKFTQNGHVRISVRNTGTEAGNSLEVNVHDTGIGIPEEFHDIIFHEFRQVSEGYSRSYEGTGLGLSIAKKFTELLGGTISVNSCPGEGSVFTVRLKAGSGRPL